MIGDSHGTFGTFIRLMQIARYLKRINRSILAAELCAQRDAFINTLGIPPDFIDGHQHVHQLPGVRDVLIELYKQQKWSGFIRNTSHDLKNVFSMTGFPKLQMILALGGVSLKNRLKESGIATNASFSGIYPFHHASNYRYYFKKFLRLSRPGGLIMCHPGYPSNDHIDPLCLYRHYEFDYLMSDAFLMDF